MRYLRQILLSFFLLNSFCLKAQLNAAFTANKTSGCAPLTNIQFTDQSTNNGSPVPYKSIANGDAYNSHTWIFGNGNSSTLQNPSTDYLTPGTYSVTLIVGNGTTFDTIIKTNYIRVFANPTANFTADDSTGCIPFTANFQDLSVKGDAPIVNWFWDFFDGNTSNIQNPTHIYNILGSHTVFLQVTDTNGCKGTITKTGFINVTNKPTANFTSSSQTISCVPPLTVNFTNSSTGTAPLNYTWYFGDGADTNITTPSHTYTVSGTFDVSLVVTDANGCKDSITKPAFVRIADVLAGFTMNKDTVCPGQSVQLTDTSLGATSWQWSSAGGTFSNSTAQNPSVSYASAGNQVIQLIAFGPQQLCSDTAYDTVNVELVLAGFTTNPIYGCEVPLTVQFNDTSVNAVSWTWTFGDGTPTSTNQNPSHIYNSSGSYNVTLTVTSPHGCTSSITKPANVVITIITPDFIADTVKGCIPLTVDFTSTTSPPDSIASYNWNFGDGSPNSNQQNPTHIYINDGDFTVTLITTTVSGCIDTVVKTTFIQVGDKQATAFSVDDDTLCADTVFTFTDETFDPALVDEWQWTIGGYDVNGIPNPPYPGTNFGSAPIATWTPNDTGFFYVQLVTGYNGCYDTLLKDSFIYVLGPYINITSSFSCDSPFTYSFDTTVFKDVHRFYWDYDDGSPLDSVNIDTFHTYASTGDYWVKLLTYNDSNACKFFDSTQIFVREIIAGFTMDTTWGCVPFTIQFNGVSSQDEVGAYQWNFGDSVIYFGGTMDTFNIDTVITHTFAIRGERNVQLIVTDVNGCRDTLLKTIKAYKPYALFSADTLTNCVPFLVNFTDTSESDTAVVAWSWSLGENGVMDTINQNTSYSYESIGQKTVTLIVTDTIGCKDTITKSNYITPLQPTPSWTISDNTICFGTAVNLTNSTTYLNGNSSNLTYAWTFFSADSTQSSQQNNPVIVFSDTGLISITLTATDAVMGCDSTVTITNFATVQPMPVAGFYTNGDSLNCYPKSVSFFDSTISDYLVSWTWNFGDNTSSSLQNPIHTYTSPNSFDVTLIVTTSYGCMDTITYNDKIMVTGPLGDFDLIPDVVCVGQQIEFWLKDTDNVTAFTWNFGDGNTISDLDSVMHFYNDYPVGGYYFPTLVLYSSPICSTAVIDTISVYQVQALFNTDTHICRSVNDVFANASVGANSWRWFFGDGDSAITQNTSHIYNSEGQYTASLIIVNNSTGCIDTVEKTISVYFSCDSAECNLNPPLVSTIPDTSIIVGEEVTLYTTTQFATTINWTPPDSLSCNNCLNPVAQPFNTTIYVVSVKDEFDCFTGYDSVRISIKNEFTVDVPSAFSPNGDNVNDTIFVRGWGIKKLILFQIYNRWGQLLFETTNIKEGWDGKYKGEPQNPETYVYVVNVENYSGEVKNMKGYITLLR